MMIPGTTTHVWKDAFNAPAAKFGIIRLAFYRKDSEGRWEVHSEITGWRKSQNPPEWFEEETRIGLFVPVGEIQ